jgi:trans-aconitate methyltransferase
MLTQETARAWIDRWDRQQESGIPHREERFTTLIDAVEAGVGRPDPTVIDLGCGPGSLSARLLRRLPEATVVAVDTDPLLLSLGRAGYAGLPGLRFVELDLNAPGWTERLGLDRPADAAVSTTALHWLPPERLRGMYADLATVLRSGGLLLNGDHLQSDDTAIAALERAVAERAAGRRPHHGRLEEWGQWWEAVAADPLLARLGGARPGTAGHHGSESGTLVTHVDALRAAGFAEIGTLWQRGDDRLLCAVNA